MTGFLAVTAMISIPDSAEWGPNSLLERYAKRPVRMTSECAVIGLQSRKIQVFRLPRSGLLVRDQSLTDVLFGR
jgi:hypothetical protein